MATDARTPANHEYQHAALLVSSCVDDEFSEEVQWDWYTESGWEKMPNVLSYDIEDGFRRFVRQKQRESKSDADEDDDEDDMQDEDAAAAGEKRPMKVRFLSGHFAFELDYDKMFMNVFDCHKKKYTGNRLPICRIDGALSVI